MLPKYDTPGCVLRAYGMGREARPDVGVDPRVSRSNFPGQTFIGR